MTLLKIKPYNNSIIKETGLSINLPLFTPVLQDRILRFEESKGYALQGTYVYKESAPERYGYPDFYNKCLDEYKNAQSTNTEIWVKNNVDIVGSPSVNKSIASGFTSGNYLQTPNNIVLGTEPWEMQFEIEPKALVTANTGIAGWNMGSGTAANSGINIYLSSANKFVAELSSTGSSKNIGDLSAKDAVVVGNIYTLKLVYSGTAYQMYLKINDGEEVLQSEIANSTPLYARNGQLNIGADSCGKTNTNQNIINLSTCYIKSNSVIWEGTTNLKVVENHNGHKFYNIVDKSLVDEIFLNDSIAWFYGIDEENERIFLPRNNGFLQSTTDMSKIGSSVSAGLPNITGTLGSNIFAGASGAFTYLNTSKGNSSGNNNEQGRATFDASRSSDIYGNSDTVQPTASINALYIVVGNTEEEKALTEVTEITTSENDTTPLFTGMYFDFAPNNPSWLKAGQQANSGSIYTSCYNELVNELTNPKYGLKVVEESEMIADVDYSEYWKINQEEMYFRTPIKLSFKALSGGVKGNGKALSGLVNLVAPPIASPEFYFGKHTTSDNISIWNSEQTESAIGLNTDTEKSGVIAAESSAQLYFKVANTVQNLELLDAGEVLEALADKQDKCIHIIDTYINSTSGYRIWSDGFCEQWGIQNVTVDANATVTLLKVYKDTDYMAYATLRSSTFPVNADAGVGALPTSVSQFTLRNGASSTLDIQWRTFGYI